MVKSFIAKSPNNIINEAFFIATPTLNGCIGKSDTAKITVSPYLSHFYVAPPNGVQSVCVGNALPYLIATTAGNIENNYTYRWQTAPKNSNNFVNSNLPSAFSKQFFPATQIDTVKYRVIVSFGCKDTSDVFIPKVDTAPIIKITYTKTPLLSVGNELLVNVTGGNAYIWNLDYNYVSNTNLLTR